MFISCCLTFSHFSFQSVGMRQATLRWLASFLGRSFIFKEIALQFLKKIQAQIIAFRKKAVVKTSRMSNSKSPP